MTKILVIDDDINALKLLGYTLHKAGFEVVIAQNGFDGLKKLKAQMPDLVVSDLMMPRMDGYEVTKRIRSNPETANIPIIMLTAKSQVADKVKGFEVGVNDYVTKPVMPAELIARIKAHLVRRAPTAGKVKRKKSKIIGFLGVKGGVGVTTLVTNLGMAIQSIGKRVILADFQPMGASVCQYFGQINDNSLRNMLREPANAITKDTLKNTLMPYKQKLQILPSIRGVQMQHQPINSNHAKVILKSCAELGEFVLADLGCTVFKSTDDILQVCNQVCLVLAPNRLAMELGQNMLQYLNILELDRDKIGIILVNQSQARHPYTKDNVQDTLDVNVLAILPPMSKLAYQSLQKRTPAFELQTENPFNQQLKALAEVIGE
ncbi:MAG: hypothetical protein B6242_11815 [Anaerolineaceae bacterium 4572_78]|nr:MAG: hypothetical protein B6242_11815 [Anaerolineaceae bacterium 4572_78]